MGEGLMLDGTLVHEDSLEKSLPIVNKKIHCVISNIFCPKL